MTDEKEHSQIEADHVSMESACAKSIDCETVEMQNAGACMIVSAGTASLHQSGAGVMVSDGEMKLVQSGAGVMVANETEVTQGFVGVLAAREVELGPDTRVLATWQDALLFGAVFGIVAAVVDLAFRGFCRRR